MAVLEPAAYGGYKDASAAWAAGVLHTGAWPAAADEGLEGWEIPEGLQGAWAARVAIMVADGDLPRVEAEPVAWAGLQGPEEEP